MAKYKLAISIPTYERPECISELIDQFINEAEKLNIGIYIFDGSISDETKKVCEKYKDYSCFNYIRQTGEIKERHWEAVTASDCDYLLNCRDRTIIKSEFFGIILRLLEENLDLYILGDSTYKFASKMHFLTSPCELFKEFFLPMTLFGSYIVRKDVLKATDNNIDAKYYKSFALLSKIFKAIPNIKDFKALFIPFDFKTNYYFIPKTFSGTSESFFSIWGDDWVKMIDDLPPCYNEYKTKAKQAREIGNILNLLDFRMNGSIDLKIVLKNKNIIKQISSTPLIVFILVALIPKKLTKPCIKIIKPISDILSFINTKINKNLNMIKKKLNRK